ncbi:MAG: amidohydrolase [Haliea sp.]|nr:amidohydrolase [Haliea sp.]|tara:strand:- start:147211 stop:149130 length:1920 start_codon:yes stop_codon:yes gene_type:complete
MKRSFLRAAAASSLLLLAKTTFAAELVSPEASPADDSLPSATVYVAREVVTLDPDSPTASAVAVVGDRILAAGSLEAVKRSLGSQPYTVDASFSDKVIVPGFIAQHDHPLLSGLTMTSEVISIEAWHLPSGTVPAAHNQAEYRERLAAANARLEGAETLLLTWGYHPSFHGELNRQDLDAISTTRPILVWHRSAHSFTLNSRALEALEIDQAYLDTLSETQHSQTDLAQGQFWEAGMFAIQPKLMPVIASPERIQKGLEFVVDYYHANGITLGSEPGGSASRALQEAMNAVLSPAEVPFRYYFIPDGRLLFEQFPQRFLAETRATEAWGRGMTQVVPGRVKLFADGAIYSLAGQMREPYIEQGHGEWIMQPESFARAFRAYWEADYQIHVHVIGDAGLDMVLDNIERNMRRYPRHDHRTVLVHFAVSQPDQVQRISDLGAIVSANPYYVSALADKYSSTGLGPERANNMVRLGDVERAGISFSYHADMPMAPGQPLTLMHAAVNRTTDSGRVAGESQRSSREGALRAVTLEAAFSLGLENEVGSIVRGKLANFTILSDNPVTVDASRIKDIEVWGTLQEGRKLPVPGYSGGQAALGPQWSAASSAAMHLAASHEEAHSQHGGNICSVNRMLAFAMSERR